MAMLTVEERAYLYAENVGGKRNQAIFDLLETCKRLEERIERARTLAIAHRAENTSIFPTELLVALEEKP